MIIDARHTTVILDVRSYREANCNTDHFLVRAKIRQRIKGMKQKMCNKMKIYNIDSLNDGRVKLKYQEGISKNLQESESMITNIGE
jgi:hypothetical protein